MTLNPAEIPAPSQPVRRPFPVTVLAILAGFAAVLAAIHALQGLGIVPYVLGPVKMHSFSLWNFLMWGLMVWIWVWLVQMLWKVDPQAWMFLAVITAFNLILDFMVMLSATTNFSDVSVSFLVNALILLYCMLPGTKRAFGVAKWCALCRPARTVRTGRQRHKLLSRSSLEFVTVTPREA